MSMTIRYLRMIGYHETQSGRTEMEDAFIFEAGMAWFNGTTEINFLVVGGVWWTTKGDEASGKLEEIGL